MRADVSDSVCCVNDWIRASRPSLQEKVLLWLLQFMQEQAISLDEVDQNGNTAVHVAAQYGHLTCIQVRPWPRLVVSVFVWLVQQFVCVLSRLWWSTAPT